MQTALAQAMGRLPQGIDPPQLRKINPADSPILYLALSAERLPLTELDAIADSRVAQRLSSLSGVAQVLVFGSQKYALRLYLDPARLQQRGLTFADVIERVQAANANLPSGTLDGATRAWTVKAPVALADARDFGEIVVAYHDGTALRLKDLGRAKDGVEDDKRRTWYNGTRAIVQAHPAVEGLMSSAGQGGGGVSGGNVGRLVIRLAPRGTRPARSRGHPQCAGVGACR